MKPVVESVHQLAADPGQIGKGLRRLSPASLLEADRRDEPWLFLLKQTNLPKDLRQLLGAAQSQRAALRRLVRISIHASSIDTDWEQEMEKAIASGDLKTARHAPRKLVGAYRRWNHGAFSDVDETESPQLAAHVHKLEAEVYRKDCRRLGRTKADEEHRPTSLPAGTITEKIGSELATGWLRNRGGTPGSCFWTDNALMHLLVDFLAMPGLPFDTVRKTRQALGLKKAAIFVYGAAKQPDGFGKLTDRIGEVFRL